MPKLAASLNGSGGTVSSAGTSTSSGWNSDMPAGFMQVPARTFIMGKTTSDWEPAYQATISKPFYMSDHELTQTETSASGSYAPSLELKSILV